MLTSAEVTEVEVGVVTTADDLGNRMTLSLILHGLACVNELEGILPSQNRMIDINEQLLPVNEFEN